LPGQNSSAALKTVFLKARNSTNLSGQKSERRLEKLTATVNSLAISLKSKI
jgi:hypothetical protein